MNTLPKNQIEQLERMLRLSEAEAPPNRGRRRIFDRVLPGLRVSALVVGCLAGLAAVNSTIPLLTQLRGFETPGVVTYVGGEADAFTSAYEQNTTDKNLGSTTIGAKIPGLSLNGSLLTGHVDAQSLTSVMYWNMTFRNTSDEVQEARARIALPKGAVVSRVTLWVNGVAQEAAFNSSERTQAAYNWIVNTGRDPVLVTQTKEGEVFVQAFPVPKQGGEMKVRIGMTAPLAVKSPRSFELTAPRLVESNFADKDTATSVKMESNAEIQSTAQNQQLAQEDSHHFALTGTLKSDSFDNALFKINRSTDFTRFAARATHSAEKSYIVEQLRRTAEGPKIVTEKTQVAPQGLAVSNDFPTASRLSTIWAAQEVRNCLQLNDRKTAGMLGYAYRIVTPVTSATVLENDYDYQYTGLTRQMYGVVSANTKARGTKLASAGKSDAVRDAQGRIDPHSVFYTGRANTDSTYIAGEPATSSGGAAPTLQGATNGTIGPQGADATVITGVNTAGTVRVNNLANLEVLLNWIVAMASVAFIAAGTFFLGSSFRKTTAPVKSLKNAVIGASCMGLAFMSPIAVNWLVALMRDANLFS